jgi:Tol biopolymer transport system component
LGLLLATVGCTEGTETSSSVADTTAATAPSTDIYLAALSVANGELRVETPRRLTTHAGYDNQPTFTPDGSALLYTSVREVQADTYRYTQDGSVREVQADTYRYTFADSTHRAVTNTPTSEYSPTPHEEGFSVVRVEEDGTQRLWQFDAEGTEPSLLLPNIQPVGYHAWVAPSRVALYVLGDPATLQLAELDAETADTLARDIGRSMHRMPGRSATISFTQYTSDSTSSIQLLDTAAMTTEPIVETRAGGDFHAWTPDGRVLMAEGSVLYQYDPDGAEDWQRVADLSPLRDITRLAVSPDGRQLALVAAEPASE